ncbi:hypothetical protein FRC17_006092, partial [Serendipita sp. 399]
MILVLHVHNDKISELIVILLMEPAIRHSCVAIGSPSHTGAVRRRLAKDEPDSNTADPVDLSLDLSNAGFKTLKEAAEVIPVAGAALKATCGIMVSILQLAKRCKENREGWEKLAVIIREKNESITALVDLYANAPAQYPSAERQANEILNNIATEIKNKTQKKSEASQGLELYWSRIQSTGRKAVLSNSAAEKIVTYQEQLRNISFDVMEKTMIDHALATTQAFHETTQALHDIQANLTENPGRKAKAVVLKPRPRVVEDFVGREDILASMCEAHFDGEAPSGHRDGPIVTVLTAMGGSGKTQIAVKFASIFEDRFPDAPVFFVDGSSETSLKADFDNLVRSQTENYDDALVWLANGISKWLLIIDNVDDPSLKLSAFLPRTPHGHIVITTRDTTRKVLAPRSTHVVDILPMEDSITLLLKSSGCEDNEVNRSLAKDIAEELGQLPLALAHAASYILVNDCLDTFLKIYGKSRSRFLQRMPDLRQDYTYSVESTIEMSFHRLSPKVQEMMQLFAHLDARSIARNVIEKAGERRFLHIPQRGAKPLLADTLKQAETLQSIFCPSGEWDAFAFDGMIGECLRYSLLRFSTAQGEKFYSMHPLVQKYLQLALSTRSNGATRQLVARLLASAITVGDPYQFFTFHRLLSPHIILAGLENVTEPGDHYGFGFVLIDLGSELAISHMRR